MTQPLMTGVGADVGPFIKAMDQVASKVRSTGTITSAVGTSMTSAFDRVTKKIGLMGQRLLALAGVSGIGYLGKQTVKMAADFQTSFSEVTTLLSETPENINYLRDSVLDLAGGFGSAQELTRALYQTISAGITKPTEAIAFLEQAAMAATAGLASTFSAVDLGTTVVNAFNLSAEQFGDVFDDIQTTIRLGKVRFEELAATVGRAAPIFSVAGSSSTELFAAIATLTQQGQRADIAVTALRQAMTSLLKPTARAKEVLKKYGLENIRSVIRTEGFAGALGLVQKTIDPTSEDMNRLFGNIRAYQAVAPLVTTASERFAIALDQMRENTGEMNTAAEKIINTFNFQLKDALESSKAIVTRGLLPALEELADWLRNNKDQINEWVKNGVDNMTKGVKFLWTNAETLINIMKGLALTFAVGKILTWVGAIITAASEIAGLIVVTAQAGGVLGGLAGAIVGVAAFLTTPAGGLIAALTIVAFSFKEVRTAVWDLVKGGFDLFMKAAGWIATQIKTLWSETEYFRAVVAEMARIIWDDVITAFVEFWDQLYNFGTIVANVINAVAFFTTTVGTMITKTTLGRIAIDAARVIFGTLKTIVVEVTTAMWDFIGGWDAIVEGVRMAVPFLGEAYDYFKGVREEAESNVQTQQDLEKVLSDLDAAFAGAGQSAGEAADATEEYTFEGIRAASAANLAERANEGLINSNGILTDGVKSLEDQYKDFIEVLYSYLEVIPDIVGEGKTMEDVFKSFGLRVRNEAINDINDLERALNSGQMTMSQMAQATYQVLQALEKTVGVTDYERRKIDELAQSAGVAALVFRMWYKDVMDPWIDTFNSYFDVFDAFALNITKNTKKASGGFLGLGNIIKGVGKGLDDLWKGMTGTDENGNSLGFGGLMNNIGAGLVEGLGQIVSGGLASVASMVLDKLWGVVKGFFKKTTAADIIAQWGYELSEGLTNKIQQLGESMGRDFGAALFLSMDEVIRETGASTVEEFRKHLSKVHDIISAVGQGLFSASDGVDAMGRAFRELVPFMNDLGLNAMELQRTFSNMITEAQSGLLDMEDVTREIVDTMALMIQEGVEGWKEMVFWLDEMGLSLEGLSGQFDELAAKMLDEEDFAGLRGLLEMTSDLGIGMGNLGELFAGAMKKYNELILDAADRMLQGADRIFEAVKKEISFLVDGQEQTAEVFNVTAREQKFLAETIMGSFRLMQEAGMPLLDIVEKLRDRLSKLDAGADWIPQLTELNRLINALEGPARRAVEVLDGVAETMGALDDVMGVTRDGFDFFGDKIDRAFKKLIEGGAGTAESLQAIGPYLRQLIDLSEKYGFKIDRNTQALIDQADAAGAIPPAVEPIEDIFSDIRSVIILLAEAMGVQVPESIKKAAEAAQAFSNGIINDSKAAFFDMAQAAGLSARQTRDFWKGLTPTMRDMLDGTTEMTRSAWMGIAFQAGISRRMAAQYWREGLTEIEDLFALLEGRGRKAFFEMAEAAGLSAKETRSFWKSLHPDMRDMLDGVKDMSRNAWMEIAERAGLSAKMARELWRNGTTSMADLFRALGEDGRGANEEIRDAADRESGAFVRAYRKNFTEDLFPILRRFGEIGENQAGHVRDAMVQAAIDATAAWEDFFEDTVGHSYITDMANQSVMHAMRVRDAFQESATDSSAAWRMETRRFELPSFETRVGFDAPQVQPVVKIDADDLRMIMREQRQRPIEANITVQSNIAGRQFDEVVAKRVPLKTSDGLALRADDELRI